MFYVGTYYSQYFMVSPKEAQGSTSGLLLIRMGNCVCVLMTCDDKMVIGMIHCH